MSKFIPIIEHGHDGTTIFRNDLIDIEFRVNGRDLTMRFDLSETAAPPLPFRHSGVISLAGNKYVYVVDITGGAWAENDESLLTPIPPEALVVTLYQANSPDFKIVAEYLAIDPEMALVHAQVSA